MTCLGCGWTNHTRNLEEAMSNQKKVFLVVIEIFVFLLFSCRNVADDGKSDTGTGTEKVEEEKIDEAMPNISTPMVTQDVEGEEEKGDEAAPETNMPEVTTVPDSKDVRIKLNPTFEKSFRPSEYNDGEYDVTEGLLTVGKNELDFPKIVGMNNSEKQKKINSLISKRVDKYLKKCLGDPVKGNFFSFGYTTKFASDNLLSLLFEADYYLKGAAHPSKFIFFINVDLNEVALLKKDDIMPVTEEVKQLFMDDKFVDRDERGLGYYKVLTELIRDEDAKKGRFWEEGESVRMLFDGAEMGFSKDYIEFAFETQYATGGYMILGLPNEMLE